MGKQKTHPNGQVDSSFLTIYLFFAAATSVLFSFGSNYQMLAAAVLWLIAVLLYVIWQVIVQLYQPGGAVLLFVFAFLVVPSLCAWIFGFEARAGGIVFIIAWVLALPIEWLYTRITKKKRHAKGPYGALLAVDRRFDALGEQIHDKVFVKSDAVGLTTGLAIVLLVALGSWVITFLY